MPETTGVPEIYADFVQISTGSLGTFLGFRAIIPMAFISPELGESEFEPEVSTGLKAIVRLDQQNTKAFAIMLRRSLKQHEDEYGTIPLPAGFSEAIALGVDEW